MENEKKVLKLQGRIVDRLPGTKFKVEVEHKSGSHVIIGYISGKMRMYYIKLQVGDMVDLEVSPYDLSKGRIIYRHK
jgi:translation initiation factor IF-1